MTYVWLRAVSFFLVVGEEQGGGGGGGGCGKPPTLFPGGTLFLPGHVSDGFPARFHVAALAGPGTGGTFSVPGNPGRWGRGGDTKCVLTRLAYEASSSPVSIGSVRFLAYREKPNDQGLNTFVRIKTYPPDPNVRFPPSRHPTRTTPEYSRTLL